MIKSMTGFGNKEREIRPLGKISVELRSTNHKFLETVLHLPENLLSLEDRIKKEIEKRVKRGRVTCVVSITGASSSGVFIDKGLLAKYLAQIKHIQARFRIQEPVGINTLIHLPGVLSLAASNVPASRIWPRLCPVLVQALDNLERMRQKEGLALHRYLKVKVEDLKGDLDLVQRRYKKAVQDKVRALQTDEERASFLKETDITEEIERLAFHIRNLKARLSYSGAVGKELDFIAQEMQREANTMGAKSCDAQVSGRVVQIKSQIEKIREQLQNIE